MSEYENVTLLGKSGNLYTFRVYDFNDTWAEVPVVYVVATTNGYGGLDIIYIGQTINLKARFSNHDHAYCFAKKAANRLCKLFETDDDARLMIENDLVNSLNPLCNK